MAARNLSMNNANVTAPGGTWDRHRLVVRDGVLVVRDRRAREVLTASVTSWEKGLNGLVTLQTDAGEITAKRVGCGCGGR
jgi:hypothetical protein